MFIYSVLRNKSPRHNKSPRSQPAISLVGVASNRPFRGLGKHQCSISRVGKHQCSISLVGDSANADSYYAFFACDALATTLT